MDCIYQLFLVLGRDEMWQNDIDCGYFSSLTAARRRAREISADNKSKDGDFDCYRHPLNPPVDENFSEKVDFKY